MQEKLPVRFGGRGKAYLCPYPYRHPKEPSRRVRSDSCRCIWCQATIGVVLRDALSTGKNSGINCARSYRTLRDGFFGGGFPGTSCQATISLSLRGLSDFGHFEKGDALKCPYTRF